MSYNKNLYPVTAQFELEGQVLSAPEELKQNEEEIYSVVGLHKIAVDVLGEYEHGTTEIEDLFDNEIAELLPFGCSENDSRKLRKLLLQMHAAVLADFFLTLRNRDL
jgi:hypothetical protein